MLHDTSVPSNQHLLGIYTCCNNIIDLLVGGRPVILVKYIDLLVDMWEGNFWRVTFMLIMITGIGIRQ